jgi:hypothetical protein
VEAIDAGPVFGQRFFFARRADGPGKVTVVARVQFGMGVR